jgi:hypothetical protein
MEVHKPRLIENWRELFKEWGIIVLGVLTALLAEQAVQSIEWHHKVDAAVADMNNELSVGDGPQSYVRAAMHDCIAKRLDLTRSAVERGDRAESRKLIDTLWVPKRTWDSLARDAATASDISSHMPHQQMLQYRIAYNMVPDMQRLSDKELADLADVRALPNSGGPIEALEKRAEIEAIEALRLDNDVIAREGIFTLVRLKLMDLKLVRFFVARDFMDARAHFGSCVAAPQLPGSDRAALNRF